MNGKTIELQIKIPQNVEFKDLKLSIESDGTVSFDVRVIEKICKASDMGLDVLMQSQDRVTAFIMHWYGQHLLRGGDKDPIMEHFKEETLAEMERDQMASVEPKGKH